MFRRSAATLLLVTFFLAAPTSARSAVERVDSGLAGSPRGAGEPTWGQIWIDGGLGIGKPDIQGTWGIYARSGRALVGFRDAAGSYFRLGYEGRSPGSRELTSGALLFGITGAGLKGWESIAVGPSYTSVDRTSRRWMEPDGNHGGRYAVDHFNEFGVAVDAQILGNLQVLGMGLHLVGNLSSHGSFAGVLLSAQLGKLR